MPRPHNHPSLSCYKNHGCRCSACAEFNTQARARERKTFGPNRQFPLGEEEVIKLRRAVGLNDDGTEKEHAAMEPGRGRLGA